MKVCFRLKSSELNNDFVMAIHQLFKNKEIKITIKSASGSAGKKEFMKAVEDAHLRKNIISFNLEEFEVLYSKLSANE